MCKAHTHTHKYCTLSVVDSIIFPNYSLSCRSILHLHPHCMALWWIECILHTLILGLNMWLGQWIDGNDLEREGLKCASTIGPFSCAPVCCFVNSMFQVSCGPRRTRNNRQTQQTNSRANLSLKLCFFTAANLKTHSEK